jgi:hypothetical protein
MYYQWQLYRSTVTGCGDGEMELEFILTFDDEHVDQNQILIYKDRGTEDEQIIFDSEVDHDDDALPVFQTVMAVDLCVPQSSNYEFVITDFGGDGFSDGGEALVFQNGVLVATIDDDFEDEIVVQLPAISFAPSVSSTSEPSLSPSLGPSSAASLEPSSAPSSGSSSTTSLEPSLLFR